MSETEDGEKVETPGPDPREDTDAHDVTKVRMYAATRDRLRATKKDRVTYDDAVNALLNEVQFLRGMDDDPVIRSVDGTLKVDEREE